MKRTWVFGLLWILMTLMLFGYNVQLQKNVILKEAQATMNSLSNSVEMDLTRAFYGLGQVFLGLENVLKVYPHADSVDSPVVRKFIDGILQENSYLTGFTVLDSNGQILHWNGTFKKPDLSQRNYFRVHKEQHLDGLYIGPPMESIIHKGQWVFGISRAFHDDSGRLTRVLSAIIDAKYFYDQYAALFIAADTQLTVSSLEGHVYTRIPQRNNSSGQIDPDVQAKIQLTDIMTDVLSLPGSDGELQLATVRRVGKYPLLVSVSKDEEAVLSDWQESSRSFVFYGIAVSLALLFLTYRTALYQRRQLDIQEELRLQAITDPLTRLYNRRHVIEQSHIEIKKARRTATPLSMIMLDLDYFKEVNDSYGHHAGDKVLKTVADLLKRNCRETDIISRFGGEEFLLILPDTDLEGAINNADKIRRALEQNVYHSPQGDFHVTASMGVTQWGDAETDITKVLRWVDAALYEAKKAGRNTVKRIPGDLPKENDL